MASIIDFCVNHKRPSKEGFDIVIGNPPYIS
ncbi:Eco57I restriction-modification methylase domain-containing protein, partial [Capnocytophaga gingivalis]